MSDAAHDREDGTLGVIVARAASKRLPGKVLRDLGGHPLIAWMVRAALNSGLDRVILSTEDAQIADVAAGYGVEAPFLRPDHLAADAARNDAVLRHALDEMEARDGRRYAICALLQSTAPFTRPADIDRCVAALAAAPALNAVFAARPVREQPAWMFARDADGRAQTLMGGRLAGPRQLTQSLPACALPAGSVWAVRADALRAQEAVYADPLDFVETPAERAADIDEEVDLVIADALRRHYGFTLLDAPARPANEETAP